MKKLLSTLWVALLLLSFCASACADALVPGAFLTHPKVWPWLLVGAAVIVAAVIIRRLRRK